MPVQEISALKTDKPLIIGWSVNRLDEAKIGENSSEIDYFGIGPIFPNAIAKKNPKPTLGMAFIQTLRNVGITKPLVAIGGVKLAHVKNLLREFGADGVAVITAITHADNVQARKQKHYGRQVMNTQNSLKQVATATMVGTAIEYFDNYIYAMAAVLVFNHHSFHAADPLSGQIAALSTLALTLLFALGSNIVRHFGDRFGRKKYSL